MIDIESLFGDIIQDDEKPEGLPEHYIPEDIQDLIFSKNKKSKKSKNSKNSKNLISSISKDNDIKPFSVLDPMIIKYAGISNITIGYKSSNLESDYIKISDKSSSYSTWSEFLVYLLGAIELSNRDNFESIISNSGILSNNIQINNSQYTHCDKDISRGLEIYKIPGTEYLVSIYDNHLSLFSSISKALDIIGADKNNTYIELYNNSKILEDSSINWCESVLTLNEFIESSMDYYIVAIGYLNEELECENLRSGIILLLCFILLSFDNSADVLKSNTIKDIVGVVEDEFEYLGFIKTTPLMDSGLYFYYNGMDSILLKYITDICNDLAIPTDAITFRVKYKG